MINFQKNDVENNALYLLKREFPNKYKNAFISDRPDIQCHEPSVGVEVVTCDFKEIVLNHTYKDISLLKLFKREKVKAIKCKDISYMFDNEFPNEYILEFLSKGIFVERDNEAIKIKNIIEFRNLYEDDILYMKDLLRIPLILSEDGNLCRVIPPAIWVGGLTDKLMTVFEKKKSNMRNINYLKKIIFIFKLFQEQKKNI